MITPIKLLPPPNTLSHNTLRPILIYFEFFPLTFTSQTTSSPTSTPKTTTPRTTKLSKTYLNPYDLTEFFCISKMKINPTKLLPPPFTPSDNTPYPHLQTNFRVGHSTLPHGNSWYTSYIDISTNFTVSSLRSNMMIYEKDNPMLHVSCEEPLTYSK